jgi:hypothetical protein
VCERRLVTAVAKAHITATVDAHMLYTLAKLIFCTSDTKIAARGSHSVAAAAACFMLASQLHSSEYCSCSSNYTQNALANSEKCVNSHGGRPLTICNYTLEEKKLLSW